MHAIEFVSIPGSSNTGSLRPAEDNMKAQESGRQQLRKETLDWISHSALEKFRHRWSH